MIGGMETGRVRRWVGLSAVILFATALSGQTDWAVRLANVDRRYGHALAFDMLRGRTVRFSGAPSVTPDTWEWDGTGWSRRAPANSPSVRYFHALAYALARGRAVLFGGSFPSGTSTVALADTWEWDGANWTQRFPAQSPPARYAHALANDIIRNRTVLFGGLATFVAFADTWEWDGVNWLQRAPASSPSARAGHALAFDVPRGRTILFGGFDGIATWFGDTWQWDGSVWTQLTPSTSPTARYAHALAYDSVRDRVVL